MSSPPPFFIVANDRSGTTMLRLILDAGPDAAIPPESMYLTDVTIMDEGAGARLDDDGAAQALMDRLWDHPKVRLWELPGPPPRVPAGLAPDERLAFILEAPFAAYARKHGKPRWGDKTPHYVHHVDEILAVWPDARFVVLVRDGRDVAISLRSMPFGPNNAWAAAQWWARGIRAGMAAQQAHPEQVMTVRYEDLVADPQTHVRAVCDFLGLRYAPEMLALDRADRSKVVKDQASWFPTLFRSVNADAVERWRREMSPREQQVFASLAATELAAHGYPVPDRPLPAVAARAARIYHHHNEFLRNVNFLRLRLVQERGRELRLALARRLHDPHRRR